MVHDSWGDDSQCAALFSGNIDMSFSPGYVNFENCTFYNAQRRIVKGFIGNTTWKNCTIRSAAANNPNLGAGANAGMFDLGSGSASTGWKV